MFIDLCLHGYGNLAINVCGNANCKTLESNAAFVLFSADSCLCHLCHTLFVNILMLPLALPRPSQIVTRCSMHMHVCLFNAFGWNVYLFFVCLGNRYGIQNN